jgi:hypothetical protein
VGCGLECFECLSWGHYGIDALGDYIAAIETNTGPIDNPARKTAKTAPRATPDPSRPTRPELMTRDQNSLPGADRAATPNHPKLTRTQRST